MNPDEAPVGTRVFLGHPSDKVTATKYATGQWHYDQPPYSVPPFDDLWKTAAVISVGAGDERESEQVRIIRLYGDGVTYTPWRLDDEDACGFVVTVPEGQAAEWSAAEAAYRLAQEQMADLYCAAEDARDEEQP